MPDLNRYMVTYKEGEKEKYTMVWATDPGKAKEKINRLKQYTVNVVSIHKLEKVE